MQEVREAVLRALAGQPAFYPVVGYENECSLLRSLLGLSTGASAGASVLLLGPQTPLQMAVVCAALSPSHGAQQKVVHLHGAVAGETSAALRVLCAALPTTPSLHTLDELSAAIAAWLEAEPSQQLVLVLQAFDRLATANQHLLYTLFDLAATHRLKIIGLSSRVDVVDLLEKRVKSRFSQNILYLAQPASYDAYSAVIRAALSPPASLPVPASRAAKRYAASVNECLRDAAVEAFLQARFDHSHDPSAIMDVFVPAICKVSDAEPALSLPLVVERIRERVRVCADALPDPLSLAEQCILVAIKRVQAKFPGEPVCFDAVFDEYRHGFAASAKTSDGALLARKFCPLVMRAAVDALVQKDLLATSRSGRGETIDTWEEVAPRIPLTHIAELLAAEGSGAGVALRRLAAEAW